MDSRSLIALLILFSLLRHWKGANHALIGAARQVKTRGMDGPAQPTLGEELKAAFEWWREAGVDCDFSNEATRWLAAETSEVAAQAESSAPEVSAPRQVAEPPPGNAPAFGALPEDLASFIDWWLSDPGLDAGRTSDRVPPRGSKGAELMVLVPEPEREDSDVLLSGPQGRLLDNILRAMGCKGADVYFASALPRHLPGADWQGIQRMGMGDILRHHIVLASPRRLIAFGNNILPLIGNDLPQGAAVLREINLEGQTIPLLAARKLPSMLERPRWKSELWKAWLSWTD